MSAWLALIGGAALATGGGIVTAWQTNWLGMKRDKREHEHQRQMANDALAQERLDRTYTELGIFLARRMDWARSVHPFMGPVPSPDPMPYEERWRIETLVRNHGSAEVQQLVDEWGKIVQKIENADAIIGLADKSRSPELELDRDARREKRLIEDEYRPEMRKAEEAIRQQMSAELAGQTRSSESLAIPARRSIRLWRRRASQAPEASAGKLPAPLTAAVTES